jgi:uncharacterized protein (DUF488 family)
MHSSRLYTIGYEGSAMPPFIACVREAGVETVVDVRELPLSRKRGFSKGGLSGHLREAGIGYVHMRSLGCPRTIRAAYRSDRSWPRYTREFLAYLATQQEAVESLAALSQARSCCVVCFEADFAVCHRTYVARAAYGRGAPPVVHLRVGAGAVADAASGPRNLT